MESVSPVAPNNNINTKYLIIATIISVGAAIGHVFNAHIITGMMNTAYEKRVLSGGEEPPKLYNYILHYSIGTAIVIVFTVIFTIAGLYTISNILTWDAINGFRNSGMPLILGFIGLVLPVLAIIPLMIVMTRKKYYLYKEDGFRTIEGIRIFSMSYSSVVTAIVVYAYIIYNTVKK
jgi:magnesium-transporting ATPase (P-type)